MNKTVSNQENLEILIDERGLKVVLALIAAIYQEKAERAKVVQGYYSDPC